MSGPERPTFSPFWHRVRMMKPRLRPHVQITRQRYRGRRWHVVHDPTSNQFYRLNPIAHDFVGMLDGTRGVETAWEASLTKFGDMAPTQNEVIQLISQLYSSNLLSCDTTPETEQLLGRGRERLKKRMASQAIGIMYFKIRLFNPDRLLNAAEPVFRPLLNVFGLIAWAALLIWGLSRVLPHWEALGRSAGNVMAPSNWGWMIFVYVVTKAWHEFGHGVICKRFGGQVPELGLMLLVLFPSPYVDASACWAFPSKWRRMAVGAGGMIFELFIASIAGLYWAWAQEHQAGGQVLTQIAYNAMFTASISTVLFNANPLMRFDGYYILADLLEVPNLMQRSMKMLQYLMQKYVYRLRNLTPPSTLAGEQAILIVYGTAAMAYRVFLFISITLVVMGKFFGLGLVLAAWTAAAWFIIPVGKFIHWLAASPQHSEHRLRGVGISLAMIATGLIVVGVIPMPDKRRGAGVVESLARSGVYYGVEGFVETVHKRPGDRDVKGEPIVTLMNPDLVQRRSSVEAQLEQFRLQERAATQASEPAAAGIAADRVQVALENLAEMDRDIGELVVRAPHDGTVTGADPERQIGAYVQRGEQACEVVDTAHVRIAASMDQRQGVWLYDDARRSSCRVLIRLRSNMEKVLEGGAVEPIEAGQRVLPNAALSYAGGGQVETEGKDESSRVSKRPRFTVRIDAAAPAELACAVCPGERVRVRFRLANRPLLEQWIERLQKEIQGRVHL